MAVLRTQQSLNSEREWLESAVAACEADDLTAHDEKNRPSISFSEKVISLRLDRFRVAANQCRAGVGFRSLIDGALHTKSSHFVPTSHPTSWRYSQAWTSDFTSLRRMTSEPKCYER